MKSGTTPTPVSTRETLLAPRNVVVGIAALLFGVASLNAGDVVGRVTDTTTGTGLPGATVTLVGTNLSAVSDSEGRFRLSNAPSGAATVRVEYLGYDAATQAVAVPATGPVVATIPMRSEVLQLERVVVEGYVAGRARAIQQKRTSTNVTEIISADAIGNLPDRNVAEAAARVAGVSITGLDQGVGTYVSIRGVEPNLNQVLVDGAIMAAPGGTRLGRAVPLDTVASSQISQIEVIKTVTPEMDANALGGTVNIKTASPFDREGRYISGSISGNYNEKAEKTDLAARVSVSDLFGPQKTWGVAASLNYDKRSYENDFLESGGWNLRTIGGADIYVPAGIFIMGEHGSLTRKGGNLSFEHRPDSTLSLYLRSNYSTQRRKELKITTVYTVDNAVNRVTLLSPKKATFDGAGTRTERRDNDWLQDQSVLNLVGGFKKTFGAFTFEPMVSWSSAKEDKIKENVLAFRNGTGGTGPVTMDWSVFDFASIQVDPTIDVPSKYPLRRTREDYGVVDEDTLTAKADLRWDSDTIMGHPGYLKAGIKYLQRDRAVDFESRRLVPVGNWTLTNVGSTLPSIPVYDGRFQSLFRIDPDATWKFIRDNPALTRLDPTDSGANSTEDDYATKEYIYAGYVMGSVTINRWTLLGGVRAERTDANIRAVESRTVAGNFVGYFPASGSTSYDEFFPNLQVVFRATDRTVLRAAISKTIGRPAYENSRPFSNFQYQALASPLNPAFANTGNLVIGNPDLVPYDSLNFDLSFEIYTKGSGMLAVAGFHKEIDNPIFSFRESLQNVVHNGIGLERLELTEVRNADSGKISGIEFTIYQPFRFLPSPWDGFGIDANLTFIDSEAKVPLRPTENLPFFRQPSVIRNIALFYEKHRFSGRIAYNYSDEQMETLGTGLLQDRFLLPRAQVDVQLRYRFKNNYALTASVRNLTREDEQREAGISGLLQTSRLNYRDYRLGLDFNF